MKPYEMRAVESPMNTNSDKVWNKINVKDALRILFKCVHACGFFFLITLQIMYGKTGKNSGNHVICIHINGAFDGTLSVCSEVGASLSCMTRL
jgi:hypothetical protein